MLKALLPVLPPSLSTCHATNFNVASCSSIKKSCIVIGQWCVFVSAFLRKQGIAALQALVQDEEGQNHAKEIKGFTQ